MYNHKNYRHNLDNKQWNKALRDTVDINRTLVLHQLILQEKILVTLEKILEAVEK